MNSFKHKLAVILMILCLAAVIGIIWYFLFGAAWDDSMKEGSTLVWRAMVRKG